jgi:hypothetical protein
MSAYQKDSVRAHTTNDSVRYKIEKVFLVTVMSRGLMPPRLPDLDSFSFICLFIYFLLVRYVKTIKLCCNNHVTEDDPKEIIHVVTSSISPAKF